MPKRSSKRREPDENETAFRVVETATNRKKSPRKRRKNPAAVALGRLGGKKGGKARADILTPEQRSDIARNAATVRWSNSQKP